jgi:hypothetical protein
MYLRRYLEGHELKQKQQSLEGEWMADQGRASCECSLDRPAGENLGRKKQEPSLDELLARCEADLAYEKYIGKLTNQWYPIVPGSEEVRPVRVWPSTPASSKQGPPEGQDSVRESEEPVFEGP